MSPLAYAQEWPEAGVKWLSKEEELRVMEFPIPGESKGRYGSSATYYPRRPVEDPGKWFADHYAKLRGLELAEGLL